MSISTPIEWADSTVNPQMGCDGCELWNPKAGIKHCYAGTLTARHAGKPGWPVAFDQPALFPERLKTALRWPDLTGKARPEKPWLNGKPRLIFLNDMGDTFTESLPVDWLAPHLPAMADSPHVWMLLTKRPKRMRQFFEQHPCPPNVWLHVSVTDQATAKARIPELLRIHAQVRGISAEPLLGPVDLTAGRWCSRTEDDHECETWIDHLSWVITGGESGHGARPSHPDWFRSLRDQCAAARVPFFFKQWGERAPTNGDARNEYGSPYHGHDDPDGRSVVALPDGTLTDTGWNGGAGPHLRGGVQLIHLGKKAAGRLLDGVEHNGFPNVR